MYVANALEIKEKRELLSDEVEDKVKFRIELIYSVLKVNHIREILRCMLYLFKFI